ncbi:MAG: 4Fe-4S dicluster domain-containing protein [Spirochaetia bacterium]|nr:4Fe-4S dicluster domain-containing protein [Spirochaetia bacterium]
MRTEKRNIKNKNLNIEKPVNRKKFLAFMGGTLGVAGLNCARKPVEKIIPYLSRPPAVQPGIATYYATARAYSEGVAPVLVKTREGKPIKIEGLAEHPVFKGAVIADTYATIWDLYDKDRFKSAMKKSGSTFSKTDWAEVIPEVKKALTGNVRVISKPSYSPSESSVLKKFLNTVNARHIVYDPSGTQQGILTGNEKSFKKAIIPQYAFDKADLILSIEADFLGSWLRPDIFTKQFASRRSPNGKMNRLVVAEAVMSLTGANADTRLAIAAGTHLTFAMGLASLLLPGSMLAGSTEVKNALSKYSPKLVESVTGVAESDLKNIASELMANVGKSLVVGGGTSARDGQEGSLQIVINLINEMLRNHGKTITPVAPIKGSNDISTSQELFAFVAEMKAGSINTLIIDRSNPVYDLMPLGFGDALTKVKNVIFIGERPNESSEAAGHVLASSHYLEDWSDGYSCGIYHVSQPVIQNIFDTKSAGDIWLALQNQPEDFHGFIQNNTASRYASGGWGKLLADGFAVVEKNGPANMPRLIPNAISSVKAPDSPLDGQRLNIFLSVGIGDGSAGNNAYRHEMPDPITKVTWDNVLLVSPELAKEKSIETESIVQVKAGDAAVELPVVVQPGLQKNTVGIAFGYGQKNMTNFRKDLVKGALKDNELGINALQFAKITADGFSYSGIKVSSITKVNKSYKLGLVQKHGSQEKRYIARIAKLSDYKKDPKSGHFEHDLEGKGLYPGHPHPGNRWNLNIDLNKCTGCSACVVSCFSENNIPAVGRLENWRGREMSWIRIDRYYDYYLDKHDHEIDKSGKPIDRSKDVNMLQANVHFQPVTCQHCEQAPCENVCPVAATQHSPDGLNEMAYNRCIGTRYCADNCPYKVRKFNWFENWENKIKDPEQYALNPDVTVRSRGVIEKCSFCIQRIAEKRQEARLQNRPISEDDLKTACEQGCPADAITFGDINSKDTKVAKLDKDKRSYKIFAEINTRPMVTFMSKVKNH